MRKLTFADLVPGAAGTAVGIVGGDRLIDRGGFRRYDEPGFRTHNEEGRHAHPNTNEIFCVYQGSGTIEIDGEHVATFQAGDVIVIEPGEDHHLISKGEIPLVFTWMQLDPIAGTIAG